MTVCCDSCESPTSARRASSSSSPKRTGTVNHRVCKRFRSTKGASKARRDHINGEIRNMRALLPISAQDQERLSYLHSMAVICTFIRKSILLLTPQGESGAASCLSSEGSLQALPGFILAMTTEGKLVYISENVSDYLGFSMVDVLQGDTFYDMVENYDHDTVKFHLEQDSISNERSFVCRMHSSKALRLLQGSSASMLVRGRFQAGPQSPVFVALCVPTVNRPRPGGGLCAGPHLQTLHKPDMSFTQVPDSVFLLLGYTPDEMCCLGWYSLLHPDDLSLGVCGHKSLIDEDRDGQVEMVLRMQRKDLTWHWVYICAARGAGSQLIECTNYIISETEAIFLKQKIYGTLKTSTQTLMSPPVSQMPWAPGDRVFPKRQHEPSEHCDEPKKGARRVSELSLHYGGNDHQTTDNSSSFVPLGDSPTFFSTPPYSPASTHSSTLPEDPAPDFLLDAYSGGEEALSPPQSSPSYYPHCGAAPPSLLGSFSPSSQSLQELSNQPYHLSPFSLGSHPFPDAPCPMPPYALPGCQSDTRLVPDYQPEMEACESSIDCVLHPEDFTLLPLPQSPGGASDFQTHQIPESSLPASVLTPDPSPTVENQFGFSEREQVEISILACQISSLASSFDTYRQPQYPRPTHTQPKRAADLAWTHAQPPIPAHTPRVEPLLDEGIIDSILKELNAEPGKEMLGSWIQSQGPPAPDVPQVQALSLDALVDSLPLERFSSTDDALDPCIMRSGCHDDSTELHQLNHYLQSGLQQDELFEESMY